MADSIAAGRWVHTFGCGHATIPVEEMYPRIGGFVGFHPMVELPLTFFTRIVGEMGVRQFVFLEGVEGYGDRIMEGYDFDPRDTMWIFSHSGINAVNIDVAIRAKTLGMKVVACGSEEGFRTRPSRHSSGKKLFEIADVVVDNCTDAVDASVPIQNHQDKIGPVSTMAFVSLVWLIITTVAERSRGAWGEALDPPVAQCAGRHYRARAARGRPARIQAADRGRLSAGQEYANPVDARVPIPDIQLPSPGWERMDLL